MKITRDNVEKLDMTKMSIDDLLKAADVCKAYAIEFRYHKQSYNSSTPDYMPANFYMSLGTYYQNSAIIKQNKAILEIGGK